MTDPVIALVATYNLPLIILSVAIAIIASYTALDLVGRVTVASGRYRQLWLIGGAIALGVGIWSMHFIGMLAYDLPLQVSYYFPIVFLSMVVAVIASGAALVVVSRPQLSLPVLLVGGIFMGLGIATMHYTGMAAIRLQAIAHYNRLLVALSIAIAISASLVALRLAFKLREDNTLTGSVRRFGSAVVMGNAIAGMHYTGMAAVSFSPINQAEVDSSHAINNFMLAVAIAVATLIILAIAMLASIFNQRLNIEVARSEVLHQSEQRFRFLVQNASDIISVIAADGTVYYTSASISKVLGYTPKDWLGKKAIEFVYPEDRNKAENLLVSALNYPNIDITAEFCIPHANGELRDFEVIAKNLLAQPEVAGIVTTYRDITERKQNQEALRKREESYRAFIERSAEGIWCFETDLPLSIELSEDEQIQHFYQHGYLAECNNAMAQMYGFSRAEEIIGLRLADFLDSSDSHNTEYLRNFIRSRYQLHDAESHEVDNQGNTKYFLNNLVGIVENGVLVRAWGSQRDITERKQVQEALQKSEERYRSLVEATAQIIWNTRYDGEVVTEQPGWSAFTGQTYEELKGSGWLNAVHPEDRLHIAQEWSTAIANHSLYEVEHRLRRYDGEYKYMSVRAVPVPEPDGSIREWVGVHTDITERQQAEAALKESEERFRKLAEKARVIPWEADAVTGNFTYVGPQTVEILGYPASNWYADNFWTEHIYPEDQEWAVNYCRESSLSLDNYEFEYRMLAADGRVVWLYDIVNVVRGEDGPQLLRGFMIDITDRKQVEEALRESNTRLRFALDAGQLGEWDLDLLTQTARRSLRHDQVFGYDSLLPDWSYEIFLNHVHPEDREFVDRKFQQTLSTGEDWYFECRIIWSDQSIHWIWARGSLYQDSDGKPVRLLGTVTDITRHKQAEIEREQLLEREQFARAEAEAANRMKDEFLATLSHELRTPLNAMLGWTQLLLTRKFEQATAVRALETISRNTKTLAQIIEDILDVSRIITGKMRLNTLPIELVPVIEAAIATVQPAAEAKSINLKSAFPSKSLGTSQNQKFLVLGDAIRLQQIFWNLLSNAVKFTPKGGRVEVKLEQTSSSVQIRVTDTGHGIDSEFLPYVFERFRQADSSITRTYGGLGLGLAIVRHLVELHGGNVYVHSPGVGQGATFTIDLPLLEVKSEEPSRPKPQHLDLPYQTLIHPTPLALDGLRVLVVDDEPDSRELLTKILGEYGAKVKVAATAREALEVLKQEQMHVLVSDIGMPEEDGYALINQVRVLDAKCGGKIPAVALTAYASFEDKMQALTAGFQLHIAKPVEPDELAMAIANLTGRSSGNTVF